MFAHGLSVVLLFLSLPFASARGLVPAKRAPSELHARDPTLWRRDVLPRSDVSLHYAVDTYAPPTATVSFAAHEHRPILLLEDMDHMLTGVTCTDGIDIDGKTMHLAFASEDAFGEALSVWSELASFAVVSAHSTCNLADERGAWFIDALTPSAEDLTLTLHARPAEWTALGTSCHVQYGHTGTTEWDLGTYAQVPVVDLKKRQTVTDDNIYTFGTSPDVSRIPLYPPNSTLAPNATDLNGLNIQLTCVDCTFKSNVTIGVDFVITLDNSTCVPSPTQNCFGLTTMNTNFTIVDLEQDANLEVFLGDAISRTGNYTVFRFPLEPGFQFGTLVNIGPSIGLELIWDFDASASLNFTSGASAQFAKGAFASFNLLDSGGHWDPNFSATGWNNFSLNESPFRLNEGQLNTTTTVALAPFAEVAFTIEEVGAAARLITAMPQVTVDAALVSNVDRQCNPVGPETFESFSLAFEVGAGMGMSAIAHFEVDEGFFVSSTGIPTEYDHTLFSDDVPLVPTDGTNKTECFVIVDDQPANATNTTANASASASAAASATVTAQSVPASTGTLLTAASAVPTWNFTKIESYFSANGQLPTGVNYTQMVQATTVPSDLQQAVMKIVSSNSSSSSGPSGNNTSGGNTSSSGASAVAGSLSSMVVLLAAVVFAAEITYF